MRARPVCGYEGCPELAVYRGRCTKHRWRGNTRSMRQRRAQALDRTHGLCARCGAKATIAHHIVERRNGGSDDPYNLLPLCVDCHRKEHHS